jgi:hypothetical protein
MLPKQTPIVVKIKKINVKMNLRNTYIMNNYLSRDDNQWCGEVVIKKIILDNDDTCSIKDTLEIPDDFSYLKILYKKYVS